MLLTFNALEFYIITFRYLIFTLFITN